MFLDHYEMGVGGKWVFFVDIPGICRRPWSKTSFQLRSGLSMGDWATCSSMMHSCPMSNGVVRFWLLPFLYIGMLSLYV